MARDAVTPTGLGAFGPWIVLIAGLVLIGLGAAVPVISLGTAQGTSGGSIAKALLLGAGLIATGAAVARRLQAASWDGESRVVSAGLLVAAGFGVLLAYAGCLDSWDAIRMALAPLAAVALVGAFLVLLPSTPRKIVVGLLICLHFGSILTSVTSVPPPNAPAPWLSVQAWAYFYRPYSSFMYLNNAYHFYSPEPGPPTLAWFHVDYSDGSQRWVKVPNRQDSPVPMHYQRLLALTESINVINHITPPDYPRLAERRRLAGRMYQPEIPLPLDTPPNVLYQPPEDYSKVMVSAYARYVARNWPHPDDNPSADVAEVKVYRVVHSIINAPAMAAGVHANEKHWDYPYFMGAFDKDGKLLDPEDPFLYWLVPILWEQKLPEPGQIQVAGSQLVDHLETHATQKSVVVKEPRP